MTQQFEKLTSDKIVLGDATFVIMNGPKTITFLDEKTGDNTCLFGNSNFDKFDKAAIKTDIAEYFKYWYGEREVDLLDVARYFVQERKEKNIVYENITEQKIFWDLKNYKDRPIEKQKHIVLGDTPFLIKESRGKMEICDKKTGGCSILFGDFDKSAIIKDLTERFKDWHGYWAVDTKEINDLVFRQREKGNNIYINITHQEENVDSALKTHYKEILQEKAQQENVLHQEAEFKSPQDFTDTVRLAKKAGYVQGVCECVAAVGDDHTLGKKLLSEMNVTKDAAKKFAEPETYKALEQGIFAPQQKLEQTHGIKR